MAALTRTPNIGDIFVRRGRWTGLVVANERHFQFVYRFAMEHPEEFHWKYPLSLPPFDRFSEYLQEDGSGVLVILEMRNATPIGLLALHQVNGQSGFAHMSGGIVASLRGSGIGIEPLKLFLDYVFMTRSVRKVYYHMASFNAHYSNALVSKLLTIEGELEDHIFRDGRLWSQLICAIYRDRFLEWCANDD